MLTLQQEQLPIVLFPSAATVIHRSQTMWVFLWAFLILPAINIHIASDHPSPPKEYQFSHRELIDKLYVQLIQDPEVKKMVKSNETHTDQFKTLLYSKMVGLIRSNITFLQQAAKKIFEGGSIDLPASVKLKLLETILNDKGLVDLFIAGKEDSEEGKKEILSKSVDLFNNNPTLCQEVAAALTKNLDVKMTEDEKRGFFLSLLRSQKILLSSEKLTEVEVEAIITKMKESSSLKVIVEGQGQKIRGFLRAL